jgi:hypothetical protein
MTGLSNYYNGKKAKGLVYSQFSYYDTYVNQEFNKIVVSFVFPDLEYP